MASGSVACPASSMKTCEKLPLGSWANDSLAEVTKVIEQIKRQAVIPLCVALPEVDAGTQRKICDMLGQIGWPTAAPFLLELAQNSETPENVKLAAMRAYRRVGGQSDNVASQFAALARRYFNQQQSLIPYPGDADNNFWRYDHFAGLQGTPVPTNIFCQVMAMTMASRITDCAAEPPRLVPPLPSE